VSVTGKMGQSREAFGLVMPGTYVPPTVPRERRGGAKSSLSRGPGWRAKPPQRKICLTSTVDGREPTNAVWRQEAVYCRLFE
jgi:hypothetical protein